MSLKSGRTLTSLGLSFILAAYPTMGAAATNVPAAVNPYAVMSAFGSPAAAATLCGSATPAAVAGTAAAAQAPAPGCVLPVVETAAPPIGQELPPSSPMVAVGNNSIFPALLVISGMAAWALLFALQDDDGDGNDFVPISPA